MSIVIWVSMMINSNNLLGVYTTTYIVNAWLNIEKNCNLVQ